MSCLTMNMETLYLLYISISFSILSSLMIITTNNHINSNYFMNIYHALSMNIWYALFPFIFTTALSDWHNYQWLPPFESWGKLRFGEFKWLVHGQKLVRYEARIWTLEPWSQSQRPWETMAQGLPAWVYRNTIEVWT